MDRFGTAFREMLSARKELHKASLRRQRAGRKTPSFARVTDRYARASAALVDEWDHISRRLPPHPLLRSEADMLLSEPVRQAEELVTAWIEAGPAEPGHPPDRGVTKRAQLPERFHALPLSRDHSWPIVGMCGDARNFERVVV